MVKQIFFAIFDNIDGKKIIFQIQLLKKMSNLIFLKGKQTKN